MKKGALHPWVRGSILQEMMGNNAMLGLEGIMVGPQAYNKCIRTGGKEPPWLWNKVVQAIMEETVQDLEENKMGIQLTESETRITHMVWADNIIPAAHTQRELRQMTQQLTTVFAERHFTWKKDSCWAMACGAPTPETHYDTFDGSITHQYSWVQEQEVLVVKITRKMTT